VIASLLSTTSSRVILAQTCSCHSTKGKT
jgi:hypothetical protein